MQDAEKQSKDRRANVADIFQELITAIVRLRYNLQDVPDADAFKAYMREGVRAAMRESASSGYSPDDIKLAAFAVVALLDESILNSKSPVFSRWTGQPLGAELTGKHLAGEEFFIYAQQLLSRPDSIDVADLLEVFYLCLLLGYRGKYAFVGSGELQNFMDGIRVKIARVRQLQPVLSAQGRLPQDPVSVVQADPWVKRLVIAASLAALIAILVFSTATALLWNGFSELNSFATH
jgi:type VI secretion system protein ImpK